MDFCVGLFFSSFFFVRLSQFVGYVKAFGRSRQDTVILTEKRLSQAV
jgi:hypothetical protein